jgi:hypothetical protein
MTSQKARPIRQHELVLAAYGFEKDQIKTLSEEADTAWKEVFTKLKETTPTHTSWALILWQHSIQLKSKKLQNKHSNTRPSVD